MFLLRAFAEPRGKASKSTSATATVPSRTWSTEFSYNGQQISDDGMYRITPIDQPYGKMYELWARNSRGSGYSRAGVYSSMDSAKNHAK